MDFNLNDYIVLWKVPRDPIFIPEDWIDDFLKSHSISNLYVPEFRQRVVLVTACMTGAHAKIIRETYRESQEVFWKRMQTSVRT